MNHLSSHETDDGRWDPESAYRRSGSARLITFIAVLLIAAAVLLVWSQKATEASGDIEIKSSMSFEEADQYLQNSGYVPGGEIYSRGSQKTRTYGESPKVFGLIPFSCTLDCFNGTETGFRLVYSFFEDSSKEKYTITDPGPVLIRIRDNLNKLYGEPLLINEESSLPHMQWKRANGDIILLGYLTADTPALVYLYFH